MERLKGSHTLMPGGFSCPEGVQPTTGIAFRLLPNLPVRSMLVIDLLQAEVTPFDNQLRPDFLLYPMQPNCCIIYIGSEIIKVNPH